MNKTKQAFSHRLLLLKSGALLNVHVDSRGSKIQHPGSGRNLSFRLGLFFDAFDNLFLESSLSLGDDARLLVSLHEVLGSEDAFAFSGGSGCDSCVHCSLLGVN